MHLKPGDIIDKDYKIISTLGEGAMSKVYLAEKEHALYAIKESTASFSSTEEEKILINSFLHESDLLYNIEHPGLPKYYKSFKHNDRFYIIMEYIKGTSLEDIIKSSGKPPEEKRVLNWGIQLCEILFYLHTMKPEPLIYRDLKPSNIIITEGDILRLIDLGVARRYDPNKDCDTVRLGTPGYAAPEQCRKKGQSTPLSDIYALGVVLHQLLTLNDPTITPFKLPPIRNLNNTVSEQLEWIINKAINLEPGDRYIDAGLFRDELCDYYEEKFTSFVSPYREDLSYIVEKTSTSPPFLRMLIDYMDFKKHALKLSFIILTIFIIITYLINPIFIRYTPDYWLDKSEAYYEQRKYEETIECLDKAIEVDPNNARICWLKKSDVYYRQKKYEKTIKCLDKAIEIDPNNARVCWPKKIDVYYEERKYKEVIKCFEELVKIDPGYNNITYLSKIGIAYYEQKKYEEAIKCFDKVIEINPQDYSAWNYRGKSFYDQGQYEEAVECFYRAAKFASKYDKEPIKNREKALEALESKRKK